MSRKNGRVVGRQLGGAAILLHYNLVLASHHLHAKNHAQICRLLFKRLGSSTFACINMMTMEMDMEIDKALAYSMELYEGCISPKDTSSSPWHPHTPAGIRTQPSAAAGTRTPATTSTQPTAHPRTWKPAAATRTQAAHPRTPAAATGHPQPAHVH